MKKFILALFALAVVASCNKNFDQAMKSADKDVIMKAANEEFANKKWTNAIALYERLTNLVANTDEAADVIYNSAYANYYDKQYKLAGHQFKNFSVTFPQDPRREDAAYMSALCYYEGSMDYNLDQSSTELAINELQNFLDNYPNSPRAANTGQLIDELSYKLEFKAYENARQYVKMAEYRAAVVAFENVLNDYPSTKLRPEIYSHLLTSRSELALGSRYDLKMERLDQAIAFTRQVEKDFPDSENARKAASYRTRLESEKVSFTQVLKDLEAKRAALTEKERREADRIAEKKITEQQLDEQARSEAGARQILRDSAQLTVPVPAATFKIQR